MVYNRDGIIYKSKYLRNGTQIEESTTVDITLDDAGATAYNLAISELNRIDPNKNMFVFGYLSDTHESTTNYWGNVITSVPSIKLLGKICKDRGISLVFHGGDLCNGREEDGETTESKLICMQNCIDSINQYLPNVCVIPTVGNHDKKYGSESALNTNATLHNIFSSLVSANDNIKVKYIDDTNITVDVLDYKLRFIVYNYYDAVDGDSTPDPYNTTCTAKWTEGLNLPNEYNASEWLIGLVAHYYIYGGVVNYLNRYRKGESGYRSWVNTNNQAGKGYLGTFNGHAHMYITSHHYMKNQLVSSNSHCTESQLGTVDAYCFSLFVVDVENFKLYWIKAGREAETLEFDIVHDDETADTTGY